MDNWRVIPLRWTPQSALICLILNAYCLIHGWSRSNPVQFGEKARITTLSTASTSTSTLPRIGGPGGLLDWLEDLRCGPTGRAIWAYQGSLYDTLLGKEIAQVEGIELVRRWGDTTSAPEERPSHDLEITRILPKKPVTSVVTMLSRKVFCYKAPTIQAEPVRRPDANHDDEKSAQNTSSSSSAPQAGRPAPAQLLRRIRSRPGAPWRMIPLDQSVSVYDTACSYIQQVERNGDPEQQQSPRQPKPKSPFPDRWWIHLEFPSGRSLTSQANLHVSSSAKDNSAPTRLEYTIWTHRPVKSKKNDPFLSLDQPTARLHSRRPTSGFFGNQLLSNDNNNNMEETTASVSPPRSSLIQVGPSKVSASRVGGWGALETYEYWVEERGVSRRERDEQARTLDSSPTSTSTRKIFRWGPNQPPSTPPADTIQTPCLKYTRHGEGPVWFGPGRWCTLELRARRLDLAENSLTHEIDQAVQKAVPLAARVAQRCLPTFWSELMYAFRRPASPSEMVKDFRSQAGLARVILNEEEEMSLPRDQRQRKKRIMNTDNMLKGLFKRWQAASRIGPLPVQGKR